MESACLRKKHSHSYVSRIITQNLTELLSRLKGKELQKLQRNFEYDALREIWELEVSIIFGMHNDEF